MTYLLTLLKLYEPNPTYALLPSTGKELMKIDGNDWPTSRNKQLKNKLPPAIPIDSGKYVHFGVENAINGISVGLINRATDLVKFFDVYQKNSNLLSKSTRARIEALDTTFQIEQAKLVLRGEYTTREAEINVPHYEMDINIDEAKLNEDKQAATITPILGKLVSIKSSASSDEGTKFLLDTSVFVIGFYVGVGKPADINSFLSNLISELILLSPTLNCIHSRDFTVSLRCVIADGPMRSYLKRTKGHSGYWACDRCIQRGEMINHTILFRNVNAKSRTDDDFWTYYVNQFSEDDHLKDPTDVSPFKEINCRMVTCFIIDPMHTVIEGAFGRRLEGFVFVSGEGKLSTTKIAEADKRIKFFHACRPEEFDRYIGKLSTCKSYKVHVKRNILYYLLYPLFKGILEDHDLQHIMLLQYGMLLLSPFDKNPVSQSNLLEAKKVFEQYSVGLTELGIPCRFVSHQVTHVWEDVKKYKCGIETISAFPFESFQRFFRNCLRSGNRQAEQIRNRCIEKKTNTNSLLRNVEQY
ncbi:uncharacterized protein LOC123470533 [Daphnia magna]|uniref:uncharacterized protein LOC123470533 n=1 Tax=Daphnia magna TaxID=35525 RepID=UPI001E1BC854|nr:uncharacterized protein LOC123470533 [Daphnia magna]